MKAAVIFNPSSGRGRAGAIASAVERGLTKRGLECELHATRHAKEAIILAERLAPGVDIVVAIGGDGTVNEVANGMACARDKADPGTPQPLLGIVPAGTVNVLALELGLPFQVERACNVIAGLKTISLDLGKVNGRRFLLMMGAGVDALTVRNIDPQAKKRFRELAFVSTGMRTVLAPKTTGLPGPDERRGVPGDLLRRREQPLLWRQVRGDPIGRPDRRRPRPGPLHRHHPGRAGSLLAGGAERPACAQQERALPARAEGGGPPAR